MHYVTFLVILALFDCNWKGEEPWIKSPSREKDKLLLIHYAFGKNSREVPLFSLSGCSFGEASFGLVLGGFTRFSKCSEN